MLAILAFALASIRTAQSCPPLADAFLMHAYDPGAPVYELRPTKVMSQAGMTIVGELPARTDKNGNPHTCLRPDPEEDLEVICLAD